MKVINKFVASALLATAAFAQTPNIPLDDTRLTVHTLVREDIFAGFLSNDMERLARGEKNAQLLAEKRPMEAPPALAWQGGAAVYRAVVAWENKKSDDFEKEYKRAQELFATANAKRANDLGVAAVTGGTMVVFGDRLPKDKQAAAWQQAYDSFQKLWKVQGASVDKLPVHISGELLAGLAVSAQRLGRQQEANEYLDRIEQVLAGSPYAKIAKQWKANPKAQMDATLTCLTCHESGRLAAKTASLK